MSGKVEFYKWDLEKIFSLTLDIPEYQRIYCWLEKNVIQLLDDIQHLEKEYRLETLILQRKINGKKETYDIIDGQQRLITLSLIFLELGDSSSPLLNKSLNNEESYEYISYNKFLIQNYLKKFKNKYTVQKLLKNLTFNVLVLSDSSLDLAYTFFSNENSRGYPLSDFDLLKAHHLRYLKDEKQSEKLSSCWDKMLLDEQDKNNDEQEYEKNYERTLGMYIFRLRKWLNFDDWNENEKYRIKNEYEAADVSANISLPNYCKTFQYIFQYKEPIQCGKFFFDYTFHFVDLFKKFEKTEQYQIIHNTMINETHPWFRDVIESLLFAYYLKFKTDYLSEVLSLIIKIISQARYENARIHKATIFETAKNSKITMIIDRTTSPSFFIAALENELKIIYEPKSNLTGIRKRYSKIEENIINKLKKSYSLKEFEA